MLKRNSLCIIVILICFDYLLAEVGDTCRMKGTKKQGACKIIKDCPGAEENAKKPGGHLTLCGFHEYTTPIVCCDEVSPSKDVFLFPDQVNSNRFKTKRISETKCEVYSKNISTVVQAIPLMNNAEAISQEIAQCPFNSVALIVGGKSAEPEEFPFMVAIGYDVDEDKWGCGGTLISDKFVLTAAHCASTSSGKPTVIRVGEINLKRDNFEDVNERHNDYQIARVILHPNYRSPVKYNDIALLETATSVSFTNAVRPACLYTSPRLTSNYSIATGWGRTGFAADVSDVLRKVALDIHDNSICEKRYPYKDVLPQGIPVSMICAGTLAGGKDTCQGDSGGPLVITEDGNKCKFYVIGITSFGKSCAQVNTPSIYTRVSEYVPWIEGIVWPNE